MVDTEAARAKRLAAFALGAGLLLLGAAWPLNWALEGLRTHVLFFPLWLGYVLTVEGWTVLRTGTSALARSRSMFLKLFLYSVPAWWLFEAFNLRLGNWEYPGREHFTDFEYFVLASVAFSTVAPAVLGTAELLQSFSFFDRFARGPRVPKTARVYRRSFTIGFVMLVAMFVWPQYCFPFAWTSLVLMLEPLNARLGRRGLLDDLAEGDWRRWAALWGSGLICGFFWEMWNHWSYPKWIYHVPYVGFGKVFEMPILGYLGYLPFALELYLLRELLVPEERAPMLRGRGR
ncbi:MAG: hypothetical protein AAF682_01350 [Planctomycetota bacterium]